MCVHYIVYTIYGLVYNAHRYILEPTDPVVQ